MFTLKYHCESASVAIKLKMILGVGIVVHFVKVGFSGTSNEDELLPQEKITELGLTASSSH